jgi:CRISPR-associated endonuclease/helicase Cas3
METWKNLVLAHLDKKTNHYQRLDVHLTQTENMALQSLSSAVQFDIIQDQELKTIVAAIGKFHDLGKFTDFFQSYIKYDKNPGDLKNHAHISALVLYRYLQLSAQFDGKPEDQEVLRYLIYLAVRLHHNHLTTEGLFLQAHILPTISVLRQQVAQLLKKEGPITQLYGIDRSELAQMLDVIPTYQSKTLTRMNQKLRDRRKHERWYFILLYLFSLLIDSDKLDSAQIGKRTLVELSPELVPEYLKKKHEHELKKVSIGVTDQREEARRTLLSTVQSLTDQQVRDYRLFTLTAPTGIGKTLSSLQAALVLRERLKYLFGSYPRIITAIPFINILQGTESDYRGVLGEIAQLVVHHQNTDFVTIKSTEHAPLDKKLLEVEAWEGDIVLTTFVQLFQSLLSGNNRRLKKLNKLAGSIVILDEIQSIPDKYMPLIGACLIKLGEYYGTRFILMTATQPKIIDMGIELLRKSESSMPKDHFLQRIELLPDYPKYFQSLHRTKIIPLLDRKMNVSEFVDFFLETWEQRSSVIVVNTIKQSLELYEELTARKPLNTEIRYLSTNLMPKHRKKIINEVRELLKDEKRVVLVSTQTIEAGVDLDFDVGYRALAPLESIVQTAGRVNRKGEKTDEQGVSRICPVYVVMLGETHQHVYDLQHLDRTKHFLNKYSGKEIAERDYQALIENYYAEFSKQIADESKDIWVNGIMKLNFDKIQQFHLIEQVGDIADIFVEWDEEAARLADCYSELKENKKFYDLNVFKGVIPDEEISRLDSELSFHQRKALLKVITNKMGEYMIQIRYRRLRKNRPNEFEKRLPYCVEAPFYWIPKTEMKIYYNQQTGFQDEAGEAYII